MILGIKVKLIILAHTMSGWLVYYLLMTGFVVQGHIEHLNIYIFIHNCLSFAITYWIINEVQICIFFNVKHFNKQQVSWSLTTSLYTACYWMVFSTFVQCFTTSYQGSSQMTWLYKYVLSVYCFVCNLLLIYLSAVVSRLLVCMHSWDTGTFSHKNVFWVRVQSSQGQNYKWTK